jgi:hypothetical protein
MQCENSVAKAAEFFFVRPVSRLNTVTEDPELEFFLDNFRKPDGRVPELKQTFPNQVQFHKPNA